MGGGGAASIIGTAALAAGATVAVGASLFGLGTLATGLVIGGLTAAIGFLGAQVSTQSGTTFDTGPEFKSTIGRTSQIRQAIALRRVIYGTARVSGPLVYATTTQDNKMLHLIVALASHEVEEIGDILLFDDVIHSADLDGNGLVTTGFYTGKVRIKKHLGTPAQAADSALVSEAAEWTTNHRLREIAYIYLRLEFDQDVFPTAIPAISAWVKGKKILDTRDSVTRWTTNPALILRDFLTDTKFGMDAAASEIDDTFTDSAANVCDEMVATVALADNVLTVVTATDVLNMTRFPQALQTGDRVQATTTGTLPAGLSLATNYFVIMVERGGAQIQLALTYANAIAGTQIDITTTGSGTHTVTKNAEPRFTANGFYGSGESGGQTIENILSAMGGRASNSGGTWRIRAGAFEAPTLTFDESDMRGPLKVQTRHPRRARFNAVRGVYASPLNSGIPTDFPSITNATYLAADNAERLWIDRNLPFTSRAHTAQRLAKIELERHRQEISVSFPVNLTGLQLEVGDTVNIDNTRMGWSGKDFEVVTWALVVEEDASGAPLLGVDLGLRETASAVFDWASGEETLVDPAPNTTLPDPRIVATPTGLSVSSQQILTGTGDETFRALVTWNAPVDSQVLSGGHHELQWRASADSPPTWSPSWRVDGAQTNAFIYMLEKGVNYDVRLRAINHIGVRSDFIQQLNFTVTSPGGAITLLDYLQASDAVTENLDYLQASDTVTENLDYGEAA